MKINAKRALCYAAFHAIAIAGVAVLVASHFRLPLPALGVLLIIAFAVSSAHFVIPRLPRCLRLALSTTPESPHTALSVIESGTVTAGVALVAVVACLSTDPLKSADSGFESAIVVLVVVSAVSLILCRMMAQAALAALCEGSPDLERTIHQTRALAEMSLGTMMCIAALILLAVS